MGRPLSEAWRLGGAGARGFVLALVAIAPAAHGDEIPKATATFPAVLLPGQTALIKSIADERVAEVSVRPGTRVARGDLMLRLVDAQERIEVKRAEALLAKRRADLARTARLHAEGQIADDLLEEHQTVVQLAEADLELARVLLEELSIRAPFDGVVAERFVDPGASVEIGDPLVRVSATSSLKIEVLLPEEMLPAVARPQSVEVRVENPNRTFPVQFRPVPVVVDPASGTFLLQLEIPNGDGRLTAGVSCRVTLEAPVR